MTGKASKKNQDPATQREFIREPIAIIGIGCRYPGGVDSPEKFWSLLRNGVHAVSEIPSDRIDIETYYDPRPATPGKMMTRWGGFLENVDKFDTTFFGISPREAERLDPQQRLLLEVAWEALEDAGQLPEQLKGSRTAVFTGLWLNDFEARLFADPSQTDFYMTTGSGRYSASGRVSYFLGLQGPSITIDTACSSSLVAVHLACQSLLTNESSLALAGGANVILQPHISIAYSQSKMMAPDGRCKFGDAQADGYVRSEGAALIVLKRLSAAIEDGDSIYAVIRGSAVNNDGQSSGFLATPGQQGQEEMLRVAYQSAGINPSDVQYVEAHGTGTRAGDPIELGALGTVLGKDRPAQTPLLVGSVKTNFGHTEGAAGIAGLIKVALALKNGLIPPSLHLNEFNPNIPWQELNITIPRTITPWSGNGEKIAGVSAFGIAGTNAHIVLTEAPTNIEQVRNDASDSMYLLPLSAQTQEALKAFAKSYLSLLSKDEALSLHNICYTASCLRTHHTERLAIAGKSRSEIAAKLSAYLAQQNSIDQNKIESQSKIAFVFPGQGAQWLGMGRELLKQNSVFHEVITECDHDIQRWADWSLLEQLALEEDSPAYRLDEISVIQPTLFAIEVALAEVWRAWGVEAAAVIGHSMGEAAAAYIAGALSLDDAARLICKRSQLMQRTSGKGAMAVVGLPYAEAEELLKGYEDKLSIAVQNSPKSTVLSGDPSALEAVMGQLRTQEIFCRLIKVDVASHSPQMDSIRPELVESLNGIQPQSATIPFYSTVTQNIFDGKSLDAVYWGRNLRQPVRFSETIQQLLKDEHIVFIEMSPHPILLTAIEETAHYADRQVCSVPSLHRDEPEQLRLMKSLGMLYEAGLSISWDKLYPSGELVRLPTYPWQRQRFWYEENSTGSASSQLGGKMEHPLLGYRLPELAQLPNHFIWQNPLAKLRSAAHIKDAIPESLYQEMALAAMKIAFGDKNHVIRQIRMHKQLLQIEGMEGNVQASLAQQDSAAKFQIFYRPDDNVAWEQLAEVELQIGTVDSSWLYDLQWQISDEVSDITEETSINGFWLIFTDHNGVGERLASKLSERGAISKVCFYQDGSVDFEQILAEVNSELPLHIVYLWGLDIPRNGEITPDGLMNAQAGGTETLVSLIQALLCRELGQGKLWVVTQGVQSVESEEPQLASATLWGLGRVIALEHSELWAGIIDLPEKGEIESQIEILIDELSHPNADDQVVYRNGRRYVPRLIPSQSCVAVQQPLPVSSDGTYLITGGLGMLGMQLSHWLIRQGARHLVLTSRSGLPDRSEWDSIAVDSSVGQRIANVRSLGQAGAQIHVVKADAADEVAMRQLVDQFGGSLPPLKGVIHAAGVTTNQTVAELKLSDWRDVLQPKVEGAWLLHQLTADISLDFFVCFSSAASVWGSQGMAAYAAANHFLDQLAYYRHVHNLPALTVNWGWWQGNGIATREQAALFSKVGLAEMPTEQALAALAYLLERRATQQVVANVDWGIFKPIYESKRERRMFSRIQAKKTAELSSVSSEEKNSSFVEELRSAPLEKQNELLTDYVRRSAAKILGFDTPQSLNVNQGFFKMGMDSLMTVQLRTQLESSLHCSLPPTIAFEYPTIAQLVTYLLKNVVQTATSQPPKIDQMAESKTAEPELKLDALSESELMKLLDSELAKAEDLTKDGK
jgi:acyl transferase domain-containing protein/acyl carrier protein